MEDIQHSLRNDIVAGVFAFGSRLTIDELATRYGVSHMPIREALRILHGEGLIIIERNRGAWVRPLHRGFVEDLFDVRLALETMLVRRAAERRTDQHLSQLREAEEILERRVAARDFVAVPDANRAFHTIINDAAGNPGALAIVDRHWLLLAALLQRYGYQERRFQQVIDDHQHIIAAIERRDATAAATLMAAHIEKGKHDLVRRAQEDEAFNLVEA